MIDGNLVSLPSPLLGSNLWFDSGHVQHSDLSVELMVVDPVANHCKCPSMMTCWMNNGRIKAFENEYVVGKLTQQLRDSVRNVDDF